MSSFILVEDDSIKEINSFNEKDGYIFKTKNIDNGFKINNITIYDNKRINNILERKFNRKFARLLNIIDDINESDGTESDVLIALDELQRLKEILEYKYQEFLKKELYKSFMDNILNEEKLLNEKLIELADNYNKEKGFGR